MPGRGQGLRRLRKDTQAILQIGAVVSNLEAVNLKSVKEEAVVNFLYKHDRVVCKYSV